MRRLFDNKVLLFVKVNGNLLDIKVDGLKSSDSWSKASIDCDGIAPSRLCLKVLIVQSSRT